MGTMPWLIITSIIVIQSTLMARGGKYVSEKDEWSANGVNIVTCDWKYPHTKITQANTRHAKRLHECYDQKTMKSFLCFLSCYLGREENKGGRWGPKSSQLEEDGKIYFAGNDTWAEMYKKNVLDCYEETKANFAPDKQVHKDCLTMNMTQFRNCFSKRQCLK